MIAAEDVEWQVAVVIVVAMKLTALLIAIERDVAGIDVEHDLLWSRIVSVNEWLEEYAGEPSRITTAGPVLHATQCGRGA